MIQSLDRYVKDDVLFTFLEDLDVSSKLASTTNPLERGIKSHLKACLHAHRGWPEERMLTALDYWLYNHSINRQPLETFIDNIMTPLTKPVPEEQSGPVEIDTAINTHTPWEDKLEIRKGWAGR